MPDSPHTITRKVPDVSPGNEVLTAMDVVLRLEAKVDVVLADHEKRIRTVESENSAQRVVAAALVAEKESRQNVSNGRFSKGEKIVGVSIACFQLLLTVLTLGPDLFKFS